MTKKIVFLLVALTMIAGITFSALAADEKSLWTIIADSFKDFKIREQDKIRSDQNPNWFQDMSDGIKDGSKKAKELSLRDKK